MLRKILKNIHSFIEFLVRKSEEFENSEYLYGVESVKSDLKYR